MTEQELNRTIKTAFSRAVPNILDDVCAQSGEGASKIIHLSEAKKKKPVWTRFTALVAMLALVLGLGVGTYYGTGRAVASTVSLDVNPSIEIKVNKYERVLSVTPLNEDGQTVVGTMDFEGSSLEITVNALIGSMLRNGYLNELANSILVSVDDRNSQRGKQLETRLAEEIDALLHAGTFEGSVLSQTITADTQLQDTARRFGITPGKAKLIEQIVAQDTRYHFEDLVSLSINELNLISESGTHPLDQVTTIGTASSKAYIGPDSAKAAALAHAQVAESDLLHLECELDFEHGLLVYELEFHVPGGEYDCLVNALTGEVVNCHLETPSHDDRHHENHHNSPSVPTPAPSQSPSDTLIGKESAKAAALSHAGLTADQAFGWECELDREDGRTVYEIEFKSGNYEFSYEIDAVTGTVLDFDKEWDD